MPSPSTKQPRSSYDVYRKLSPAEKSSSAVWLSERGALQAREHAPDQRLPTGFGLDRQNPDRPNDHRPGRRTDLSRSHQAFDPYEARYVSVPMDSEGMILSKVQSAIRAHRPKFAYLVPTFQNPPGITMSADRRQQSYRSCASTRFTHRR